MRTSSETLKSALSGDPAAWQSGSVPLLPEIKVPEQEVRTIVDAIPHNISVFRPDGAALYVNRAFLQFAGLTMDELMAADFHARLYQPDYIQRVRAERPDALPRGMPFETEQRARRRCGQYR